MKSLLQTYQAPYTKEYICTIPIKVTDHKPFENGGSWWEKKKHVKKNASK